MSYYDYIHNIINNQAFINTDAGVIFEFTAANATQTYDTTPDDNVGFSDVSAIAVYNIASCTLDKLFYFQLYSALDTTNIHVIKHGINTNYKFNILFSNALLTYTNFTINAPILTDYITYLAYSIVGVPNMDIFTNKSKLLQTVKNMDSSFNNTINQNIAFCGINNSNPFLSYDLTNPFVHSTKQLVTGMLTIANPDRKQVFYDDLLTQSESSKQNIYWVRFHTGDKMSVLINYLSTSGVKPRSYKIILNCLTNFIFPVSVSNVGLNINGNLDPFYILNLVNSASNSNLELDSSFVSVYNSIGPTSNILPIYKQIGVILNPLDMYYKTFLSNITQPSLINDTMNGIINNGINPSFQYIYLNSTITTILYPSLRKIKESLLTSPYDLYPTLNEIKDIQCDLKSNTHNSITSSFIIRIYTRPNYTEIDNSLNPNDSFYGNYYDSDIIHNNGYTTYHLSDLFSYWSTMINTSYNKIVYYNGGLQKLRTLGQQQVLSICIMTYDIIANIGIKNIIVTYK